MNKKIKIYPISSFVVFIIIAISVVVFNSCQKDLPMDPVYTLSGKVTGTVIDRITSDSIPGADIKIYRVGTTERYEIKSDKSGKFSVAIPVIPDKKPFRITVSKLGYQTVDTTINCACDIVDLKLVPLDISVCGIYPSPDTLYFSNTTLGAYKTAILTITNKFLSSVLITGVEFSNPLFKLSANNPNLPFTMTGLQIRNLEVEFTPTSLGNVIAEMNIKTDCSSNKENIIVLVATSIQAPCATVLSDTTGKMLGDPPRRLMDYFVNKTCTVRVYNNDTTGSITMTANYSLVAQLSTTQTLLNSTLGVSPSSPVSIPSGQWRDIVITVKNIVVGDIYGLFTLTTSPGGCTVNLPLWVQFYEEGYTSRTLYRWSQQQGIPTNPYGIYKGFSFRDSLVINDSSAICPGDINFGVSNRTTDIRFDGIVVQGSENFAVLKSYGGIQLLGNVAPGSPDAGKFFVKSIWMPRVIINGIWDQGCNSLSLFKKGDVIAVRYKDFTSYGLLLIDNIWFTNENYERFDFSFIKN